MAATRASATPASLALVSVALAVLSVAGLATALGDYTSPRDVELDYRSEDLQRKNFNASDFMFTFPSTGISTEHGSVNSETVNNRPALATLPGEGVAQTLVTLKACAINQPHSHPRGTEFSFVTKGKLLFGFIEENKSNATKSGGRFINTILKQGQSIVIPQGLIHFALNQGCDDAQFVASFPTRDQGTQTTFKSILSPDIPLGVLRATTGLKDADIDYLREKVAANPNPSADPECLTKCKYQK